MKHIFDVELAAEIGINAAIILENLLFWCKKNKANNKNIHDDVPWTYNSIDAFQELFPYMTGYSIRKALTDLEVLGYIKTGNFNKNVYDKTKWYSVTKTGFNALENTIFRKQQMGLLKTTNGSFENNKPIPDINTDINTDIKTIGDVPSEQSQDSSKQNSTKLDDKPSKNSSGVVSKKTTKRKATKILNALNTLAKKSRGFRPTDSNLKGIIARLNEGFSVRDCIQVIETKLQDPYFQANPKYYRPTTLFGSPANFESYLNEDPAQYNIPEAGSNRSGLTGTNYDKDMEEMSVF